MNEDKDRVYEQLEAYLKYQLSSSPYYDEYCAFRFMLCLKCEYCAKYFDKKDSNSIWNNVTCVGGQLEHYLR